VKSRFARTGSRDMNRYVIDDEDEEDEQSVADKIEAKKIQN